MTKKELMGLIDAEIQQILKSPLKEPVKNNVVKNKEVEDVKMDEAELEEILFYGGDKPKDD